MSTSKYTKGQKQALLESLNNQYESGIPMTTAERELFAELTKETLNKRVLNKLNNFSSKLSEINSRINEIESSGDFIFKAERLELDKLNNEHYKISDEVRNYISEKNVSEDEFYFSDIADHFDGVTFEEIKNN